MLTTMSIRSKVILGSYLATICILTIVAICSMTIPVDTSYGCYEYNCSYALFQSSGYNYYYILTSPNQTGSNICWLQAWVNQSWVGNASVCYTPESRREAQCSNYLPPNGTRCYTQGEHYSADACPGYLYCDNLDVYVDRFNLFGICFAILLLGIPVGGIAMYISFACDERRQYQEV